MLLPRTCPVCGAPGTAPCAGCEADLRPAPALPAPPGVDGCAAFLAYDGAGRELVARLKYRNARASVPFLARGMAALAGAEFDADGRAGRAGIDARAGRAGIDARAGRAGIDVVTWAPTTPARLRARGFDQARVLARAVARELGVPCRRLLRRLPGPAQTGRDAVARRTGPAFAASRPLPGRRVLLVDDVVTTGATVAAAARALTAAGAERVSVVAAARTPPGRGHVHSGMPASRKHQSRRQQWK